MIESGPIRERFMSLSPHLSERERRLFAATEARAAGYGGIAAVSAATGIAVSTIGRGLKELSALASPMAFQFRLSSIVCPKARPVPGSTDRQARRSRL